MKITATIFIVLSFFGISLAQIVNHIYIESASWMDSEGTLSIIDFKKNNLYQRCRWNITTHQIQVLDAGEYFVVNDTISCRSTNSKKFFEFVYTKLDGKNVLFGNDKVYNQDGSLSTIRVKGPPREELGKELYQQWKKDLSKN